MPLENPFSFLRLQARKRKKRFLGTPQTPAGGPLHPLGKGVALKLMPMGDTPIGVHLSGSKGRCPSKTPSLSRFEPLAPSAKEKKTRITHSVTKWYKEERRTNEQERKQGTQTSPTK